MWVMRLTSREENLRLSTNQRARMSHAFVDDGGFSFTIPKSTGYITCRPPEIQPVVVSLARPPAVVKRKHLEKVGEPP